MNTNQNTIIVNNTGRYFAAHDVGTFYRMNRDVLEYQPMLRDPHALPIENDWYEVDEEMVGDETITYESKEMTFSELYAIVRRELS